ncbi:MAG: SDR family oxidoreductase [Cyanobacteriota bacterium]|nr:SDR family oxidoreductase [Cyanobacteriota bacterium]
MFLVTGATGDLGRRIVRQITEREMPVRGFVRLKSRYSELETRGAEIFIGDLRRDKDIRKACQDVKYIISTHSDGRNPQAIDYAANVDLIDAAKEYEIQHFVFVSALGVDRGYEDAPTFKAKRQVEKYLEASGLNYTILRPAGLSSSLLPQAQRFKQTRGVYLLIGDPKNRTSIVSTDDVAKIAIDSAMVPDARDRIFAVGGPEIISRQEIPYILGAILKEEPTIIKSPLMVVDGVRNVFGLFNSQTEQTLGTFRVFLANEFFCTPQEVETVERIFNIKMESLDNFLRRYLSM